MSVPIRLARPTDGHRSPTNRSSARSLDQRQKRMLRRDRGAPRPKVCGPAARAWPSCTARFTVDNALHSGGPAGAVMNSFEQLQAQLGPAWALNRPGVGVDHVLVVLPSFSVGESLLSHYADRIPALEHRYLRRPPVAAPDRGLRAGVRDLRGPEPEVVDYYTSLVPADAAGQRAGPLPTGGRARPHATLGGGQAARPPRPGRRSCGRRSLAGRPSSSRGT